MANSKSNIYPIQLQNAELCLNRYDAEIKQYSGFNKNNAPFVGGCLSNIFTKNETRGNSNTKNTYIDVKGNIYTLDNINGYGFNSWWMKKNSNVVLKGDSNKFLVNEELNYDKEVAIPLTEDLFVNESLSIDSVGYFIYGKNGALFKEFSSTSKTGSIRIGSFITSLNREGFKKNNITRIFFSPDGNKNYCIFVAMCTRFFKLIIIDLDPDENNVYSYFSTQDSPSQNISTDEPIAICYDEVSEQFSVFYNQDDNNYKFGIFFTLDFTNKTITYVNSFGSDVSISSSILSSGEKLVPASLISYHFLSYPENRAILSRQPNSTSAYNITDQTPFKIVGRLEKPYYDGGIKFRSKTVYNYKECRTVATSFYMKIGEFLEDGNSTRTPIMYSGDVQNAVSETYNDSNFDNFNSWCVHQSNRDYAFNGFHFSDYTDPRRSVVYKRGKYALGDYIPVGKGDTFYFAMNNNLLSAICSKYVLLTEWNSIDAKNVYFFNDYRNSKKIRNNFDERIFYKVNDKWYVIKLDELPTFRVFDNQIVVNVDSINNSYDFARNKILHFANPYNSIIDTCARKTTLAFYSLTQAENTIYVGGAVNEYNQEDNSSIILNPVSIAAGLSGDNYKFYRFFVAANFNEFVNIYSNVITGGSTIIYLYSAKWDGSLDTFKFDAEKEDFPFPIDTNGNVEYNVNLFSEIKSIFATMALIRSQINSYPLVVGNNNNILMNYYLASGVEGLEELFIIQGQTYGICNNYICSLVYNNGVISEINFIVNVQGLQFCGNNPYEVLFYSKTNRCLYSFTGANILNTKQFVDKISVVKSYKYNPSTQSIFLLTDIGVIVSSLFGIYQIDMPEAEDMFLLDNGVILCDNEGHYRYIRYYKEDTDETYIKQNIQLDTCFYGMNNQTVTINDCLYMRIFSEEHEEGVLEISATTLSLHGRKTEKTTFKLKKTDWDAETHTYYLRYQPKLQRGLGISFKINSPFKIAALSIGTQADAILIDKASKGAINAPERTSSITEW